METLDGILASWPWDPWLAAGMAVSAAIYARGWWLLRRRDVTRWTWARLAAFCGGLATIYVALASPIETFASLLLQVHMVQHLLLTMVAPPLLWLGAPLVPLVRAAPRDVRKVWIAPLLNSPWLRQLFGSLTYPVTAWLVFVAATWLWHIPTAYELALREPAWHYLQHICFLAAGLVFWYPVVRPFPARPAWPLWMLVPYLILADIQNTVLSALFTFSNRVVYPHYEAMPRLGGVSALDDQATAGVVMWVPGSLAFLLPLGWIGVRLMQSAYGRKRRPARQAVLPILQPAPARDRMPLDLLQIPLVGPVLRHAFTRRVVQMAALVAAVAIIVDGLWGPQVAPMNLAGVVPWIHWRGFIVFGLLAIGNVFCYGCPFTLPRAVARRWLPEGRPWPRWLRSKWLAVALLALFLWSYEAFALWDSPWLTAWIALAYFAGALVVDGLFRDAPFCKYVCPIGQFHFVQSIVSPLEVRVKQSEVCASCTTHDCIAGTHLATSTTPHASVRGCELHLFQPRKSSNLDCTFCLDCVRACPHENVGLLAAVPTASLWQDRLRSGIGRLSRRTDLAALAALAALLVFGSLANAAGMIAPVVQWEDRLAERWQFASTFPIVTAFYLIALIGLPVITAVLAASVSQWIAARVEQRAPRTGSSLRSHACRFVWSLVPLGFAMWMAHYSFHFFTSFETIVPAAQRFAADFGLASLGSPDWQCSCCRPAPDWLLHFELLALDVGLLASLYLAWRIAWSEGATRVGALKIAAPWMLLSALLFAAAVWILLQPMEMRGTMPG